MIETAMVTLLNDNFLTGYIGFMKSLMFFNPKFDYPFYILDDNLSKNTKLLILKYYKNITFINIDKEDYANINLGATRERLRSTYYKLDTFKLHKYGIRHVVFIDMDILVQGDISPLFDIKLLKDKMFGACLGYRAGKDTLGPIVNSGVFAVDFTKLPGNAFNNLLKLAMCGRSMPDQDVINYYFVNRNKCTFFPKEYNVEKRMMKSKSYPKIVANAKLLHFVNIKPWEKVDREQEFKPLYDKWWRFRKISVRNSPITKPGLQTFIDRCHQFAEFPLKTVVEVGSYVGDSTEIFSNNFDNVVAIDPWKNSYDDKDGSSYLYPMNMIEAQFDELVKSKGNIKKIKTTSVKGAKQYKDESLDMVYIDAVHQYKNVVEDMKVWYPKIKYGGILSGHDFTPNFPGCMKAIKEYIGSPTLLSRDTSWGVVKGNDNIIDRKLKRFPTPDLIKIEDAYVNFLKNKRIIFVGPSPCIKGKKLGKFIDSYDIVIRSGNMLNVLKDKSFYKDYGSKSDILYVNVHFERDCGEAWHFEEWEKLGLKFICKKSGLIKNKNNHTNIRVRNISNYKDMVTPDPTLGLSMLVELLTYPIKSLYITGVDAFITANKLFIPKNYPEYVEGYLPAQAKVNRDIKLNMKPTGHNNALDARVILDFINSSNKCTMDPECVPYFEEMASRVK